MLKIQILTSCICIAIHGCSGDSTSLKENANIEFEPYKPELIEKVNIDCPEKKSYSTILELNKLPRVSTYEKRFPKIFDSLKTIGKFRSDISLDSIDKKSTFEKLAQLSNMKSIDISLSNAYNRPTRRGINLLNQVKQIIINGARSHHLTQLANLDSLIHLEIGWYNVDSTMPEETFYQKKLRTVSIYASHIINLPLSIKKLCLLEEFTANKSSFHNLPFDNSTNLNLKTVWMMNADYFGESFAELENFESLDTLFINKDMLHKLDSNYILSKTVEGVYFDNFYKIY